MPAENKLSSIESIIMKAIQLSNICEKNYLLIQDELHRYCKLKEYIRTIIKCPLNCVERKRFIEYGRNKISNNQNINGKSLLY